MSDSRWSTTQANQWYSQQPWLVGCNFTPSTAINQLEMWQAETFDPATIDRELGWAASLGFNCVRVYLHDLLWMDDAQGFTQRISRYLEIASGHDIRTMFVIFDDCWDKHPQLGKQRAPLPGVHNSGWVQSPGDEVVVDPSTWGRLETYVKGVVGAFASDQRVLACDVYNEPGNGGLAERSAPLLQRAYDWSRSAKPAQPLTCGIWWSNQAITAVQVAESDIITFHDYEGVDHLRQQINDLRLHNRPLICTEYMARPRGSRFQTHLPVFKQERVGCLNWGLVSGKTQTCYPWGSQEGSAEPEVWFHDIFRSDGTPFDLAEAAFIRQTILR